jgi:outer membrane protein assembly factor BamE (lipoprotein component of BamABCDE complex)
MIREEHRGKPLSDEALNKLQINKSTKEQVIDILGTPSCSSTFDDNLWYYMSLKKKGVSVLKPGITDQKVVQLRFKDNRLVEIKTYNGGDKAKSFKFNQEKTKVEGHEQTVLKEFTRNIGRYNK